MKFSTVAVIVGLTFVAVSRAADEADVYCKDGQLRAPLLLRQVQGGSAGYSGQEVKVGTDGKWTVTQLMGKKSTLKMKGTLSKENVEALAQDLARYDLISLKNYGRPAGNSHVVAFEFGRLNGTMILLAGQPLPRPEAGNTASLPARYSGVVHAVQEIIRKR